MTIEERAEEYSYDVPIYTESQQLKRIQEAYIAGAKENDISTVTSDSDKRLERVLQKLKDLGVIKSWYFNGTYHAE